MIAAVRIPPSDRVISNSTTCKHVSDGLVFVCGVGDGVYVDRAKVDRVEVVKM